MNAHLRSFPTLPRRARPAALLWVTALSIAALMAGTLFVGTAHAGKFSDRIVRVTDPKAPRSLPVQGTVAVSWEDPAKFSELRGSGNRSEAERGDWVTDLARYLRQRAERKLPGDERLEVTITDIRRAGNFEPWRGIEFRDVRILRELYWPRIAIDFKLTRADGSVAAEGQRVLSDPSYLGSSSIAGEGDPLRYEKALIDRWVRRELGRSELSGAPNP
jgi:Protein of unknown function (DUF3016)